MATATAVRRARTGRWGLAVVRRIAILAAGIAAAALGALVVYPAIALVVHSLTASGHLTLSRYAAVAADPLDRAALRNSLIVCTTATAGATALGVSLAWLVARTDLPRANRWHALFLVPYMIPPFIGAIAWVYLLSPAGYLNEAWMTLTGAADPLAVIYGPAGIVSVMILYEYPIAYLTVLGVLRRMNPALEEAARITGARPGRVFREITVPLILPGVAAAALLVLMASLGNFGIPAILGFPARYAVLTTRIYDLVLDFDRPGHLQSAAALAMWLMAVAAVILAGQRALLRQGRYHVIGGQSEAVSRVPLGLLRGPVLFALTAFVVVGVVLPLAAILLTSLTRAYGLPPVPANLTLAHYRTVLFGVPKVQRALGNSLLLAAGAATSITLFSAVFAYLKERARVPGMAALELLISLPYAVPGTIVALAMILAWLRPLPVIHLTLYNTLTILFAAYVARFCIFGVRTALAGLAQVHGSLEEAARISGARPADAFWDIVLPLIRPSLLSGWLLAFVPAVAELTLSILLFSVGRETLGVVIFGLHEEGKIALSAALAFLVTIGLVGIAVGARLSPPTAGG